MSKTSTGWKMDKGIGTGTEIQATPLHFQKRILGTRPSRAPGPSCTQDGDHHRRPCVPSEHGSVTKGWVEG